MSFDVKEISYAVGAAALVAVAWALIQSHALAATGQSALTPSNTTTTTTNTSPGTTISIGGSPVNVGASPVNIGGSTITIGTSNANNVNQFPLFGYAAEPSLQANVNNYITEQNQAAANYLSLMASEGLSSQQMQDAMTVQNQNTLAASPTVKGK